MPGTVLMIGAQGKVKQSLPTWGKDLKTKINRSRRRGCVMKSAVLPNAGIFVFMKASRTVVLIFWVIYPLIAGCSTENAGHRGMYS